MVDVTVGNGMKQRFYDEKRCFFATKNRDLTGLGMILLLKVGIEDD